jgi:hypothetical protein
MISFLFKWTAKVIIPDTNAKTFPQKKSFNRFKSRNKLISSLKNVPLCFLSIYNLAINSGKIFSCHVSVHKISFTRLAKPENEKVTTCK